MCIAFVETIKFELMVLIMKTLKNEADLKPQRLILTLFLN